MRFVKKLAALLLVASVLSFQVPANIANADEAAVTSTCAHRTGALPPSDIIHSTYTHTVLKNAEYVTCTVEIHQVSTVQQCFICYQKFYTPYNTYEIHSVDHIK